MKDMWEERYAADEYAYGEEPNAFFKACLDGLPAPGRLLLPGEGEGRNAVYAARQGWIELEKVEAEIHEGRHHTGLASVVRLVAKR